MFKLISVIFLTGLWVAPAVVPHSSDSEAKNVLVSMASVVSQATTDLNVASTAEAAVAVIDRLNTDITSILANISYIQRDYAHDREADKRMVAEVSQAKAAFDSFAEVLKAKLREFQNNPQLISALKRLGEAAKPLFQS